MVLPDADAMKRFLDGDDARPALVFLDADESGQRGREGERGPDDSFLRPAEVEEEVDVMPATAPAAPRTLVAQRSPLPARAAQGREAGSPAPSVPAVTTTTATAASVEDDGVVGQCVLADRSVTAAGTVRRRPQAGKTASSGGSSGGVSVRPPSAVNAIAATVAAVALAILGISLTLDTGVWRLLTQLLGVNLR